MEHALSPPDQKLYYEELCIKPSWFKSQRCTTIITFTVKDQELKEAVIAILKAQYDFLSGNRDDKYRVAAIGRALFSENQHLLEKGIIIKSKHLLLSKKVEVEERLIVWDPDWANHGLAYFIEKIYVNSGKRSLLNVVHDLVIEGKYQVALAIIVKASEVSPEARARFKAQKVASHYAKEKIKN